MADETTKKLPIDKEYLITSLKSYEENVLDKKYGQRSSNQSVLDKLSESKNGTLLFNGNNVGSGEKGDDGKSVYDIAVNNGFEGTEQDYLDSLKGEKGNDGRSISQLMTDDNNNVIVTFSDGKIENIGQLNIDVHADFLTSGGFGNLRYYNGKYQYFNTDTETWVDAEATQDNLLVVNMMPNPMRHIVGIYDYDINHYKLRWTEPEDTVVDGQLICAVEKVVIRRKLDSAPQNENDGELVRTIDRKDFGSYKNIWYIDENITPNIGDEWYYKAFPISTAGFVNSSTQNETGGLLAKDYHLYGFKIDQNESDPASMITYIEDNKNFRSAFMNYTHDKFDYGDWEDSWFIQGIKPCMLNYDGTVAYELDKNDYTKKIDGTDSEISNENFTGNVMVGIPKVYWKIVDNGDDTANIYFSDKKLDDDFICWSHIDNNGNEIQYCYIAAYNGTQPNPSRLIIRSLSGLPLLSRTTAQMEIDYALANNITDDVIWYTEVFSDRMIINLLLLLIGKSTDSQTIFGNGHYIGKSMISTGTMNKKGLFWGTNDTGNGVKVFGIEHYYGNQWRRVAGWISDNGIQKVKMTYGQSDGSSINGYNLDGNGYIEISNSTPSGVSGGYISKMLFDENGLLPIVSNGSATTYYADSMWFEHSGIYYALMGGCYGDNVEVGIFATYLSILSSYSAVNLCVSISCKPLLKQEVNPNGMA